MTNEQRENLARLVRAAKTNAYTKSDGRLRDSDQGEMCFCIEGLACEVSGAGFWNRDAYESQVDGLADSFRIAPKIDATVYGGIFFRDINPEHLEHCAERIGIDLCAAINEEASDGLYGLYHWVAVNEETNLTLAQIGALMEEYYKPQSTEVG